MNVSVTKLARTLGVTPGRLEYLRTVPHADVQQFHEMVTQALIDANSAKVIRVARISSSVPASLMATVAERSRSPLFAARFAGMLDSSKAVSVARRLSGPFLAAVAAELAPAQVREIVGSLPPELGARVAVEIAARRDWITLGDTVSQLPKETVVQSIRLLDDIALLMTSATIEDAEILEMLTESTPVERIVGIVETAAEYGLVAELSVLARHFTDEQQAAAEAVKQGTAIPASPEVSTVRTEEQL